MEGVIGLFFLLLASNVGFSAAADLNVYGEPLAKCDRSDVHDRRWVT